MKPDLKHIFKDSFRKEDGSYNDKISEQEHLLLFEHGLLKCFLPKELNGLGLSLQNTLEVIREASFINGSLGWLIQIGNGGNYFASCFNEETTQELFLPKDAVIAGSGAVAGTVERKKDGVILNGTWGFCSGSDYATLFTVSFQDEASGEKKAAILNRNDVNIFNDWNTTGLKNTSTNSIQLKDVFVPERFIFEVEKKKSLNEMAVFQLPFVIYAQAFFSQVVLGLMERMIFEAKIIQGKRAVHWSVNFPSRFLKLDALIQKANESLEEGIRFSEEVSSFWINSSGLENHEIEKIHRSKFLKLTQEQRQIAHDLYWVLGIEVVYEDHPVSVIYRDLLVCSQHYLLNNMVD